MAQRRQVTTGSEGPLTRHHRHQSFVEEIDEPIHRLRLHAAVTSNEAAHLEQEHPAHHLRGKRCTEAGGVAAKNVVLQLMQLILPNPDVRQLAKARVDPIDRTARGHHLLQKIVGTGDVG